MTVFVSRHRLTPCPSCDAHIRVEQQVANTRCPFCGEKLTAAMRRKGLMPALGRGGLLAGALLGLSMTGGCEEEDVQPVYGAPADVMMDVGADAQPAPVYGEPADIQVETSPDFGPQPEYGAPPSDF